MGFVNIIPTCCLLRLITFGITNIIICCLPVSVMVSKEDNLNNTKLKEKWKWNVQHKTRINKSKTCVLCFFNLDACDIYTWGLSTKGTLGHGEEEEELVPRVVEALLGRDIRKLACGHEHTLAVSGKISITHSFEIINNYIQQNLL